MTSFHCKVTLTRSGHISDESGHSLTLGWCESQPRQLEQESKRARAFTFDILQEISVILSWFNL